MKKKAFDFVNRFDIVRDLMMEKAGARFVQAIASMYVKTFYVPKTSETTTGQPILAQHGVTQGRKSSTSLFSFTMRNIPKSVHLPDSFLEGNHVYQLADDSSIATNSFTDMKTGFGQLIDGSDEKFMKTNIDKTFYLHLFDNPTREDMLLANGYTIKFAVNDEHLYLGMWFTASADVLKQIFCNLSKRAFHIKLFTDWLEINEMTPISIKIQVLYLCMFAAYLYGAECWWKIDAVKEKILLIERKMLKRILQVKPSTPNEIIYTELGRCDIITKIKVRQKRFFERCNELTEEEASLKTILNMCKHLDMYKYYESLPDGMDDQNRNEMRDKITTSTATYCTTYKNLTGATYNDAIYGQFLREDKRAVLTRWRLSCHSLQIERGRYTSPLTPRDERTCPECPLSIEDEHHVLFNCPLYHNVRFKFRDLLLRLPTVCDLLNPTNIDDANEVCDLLRNIEEIRKTEKI